jgi:hypothetical protein
MRSSKSRSDPDAIRRPEYTEMRGITRSANPQR